VNGAAERYPLDYDALAKGDVIGRDRLAVILDADPESALYHARLVGLMRTIEEELELRGRPCTVRSHQGTIEILDDAAASAHNQVWFRLRCRGLKRSHRRMLAVDAANLDAEQLRGHDRALVLQGRTLAAMAAARAIRPAACQRPIALPPPVP
jgi:hypothetical protein